MWYIYAGAGFLLACFYILIAYCGRKDGQPPSCNCSCGPIHHGMLYICNIHIHHWLIFLIVLILSIILYITLLYDIFIGIGTFSTVLVLQGLLCYKDSCKFGV